MNFKFLCHRRVIAALLLAAFLTTFAEGIFLSWKDSSQPAGPLPGLLLQDPLVGGPREFSNPMHEGRSKDRLVQKTVNPRLRPRWARPEAFGQHLGFALEDHLTLEAYDQRAGGLSSYTLAFWVILQPCSYCRAPVALFWEGDKNDPAGLRQALWFDHRHQRLIFEVLGQRGSVNLKLSDRDLFESRLQIVSSYSSQEKAYRLFLNGQQKIRIDLTEPLPSPQSFLIGRSYHPEAAANLTVGDFSLWSRALSVDEVKVLEETQKTSISWYAFQRGVTGLVLFALVLATALFLPKRFATASFERFFSLGWVALLLLWIFTLGKETAIFWPTLWVSLWLWGAVNPNHKSSQSRSNNLALLFYAPVLGYALVALRLILYHYELPLIGRTDAEPALMLSGTVRYFNKAETLAVLKDFGVITLGVWSFLVAGRQLWFFKKWNLDPYLAFGVLIIFPGCFALSQVHLDTYHWGVWLAPAYLAAQGVMPLLETSSIYGLVSILGLSGWVQAFGSSHFSLLLFITVTTLLSALLVYRIIVVLTGRPIAAMLAMFFLIYGFSDPQVALGFPNTSPYRYAFFPLLGIYLLIRSMQYSHGRTASVGLSMVTLSSAAVGLPAVLAFSGLHGLRYWASRRLQDLVAIKWFLIGVVVTAFLLLLVGWPQQSWSFVLSNLVGKYTTFRGGLGHLPQQFYWFEIVVASAAGGSLWRLYRAIRLRRLANVRVALYLGTLAFLLPAISYELGRSNPLYINSAVWVVMPVTVVLIVEYSRIRRLRQIGVVLVLFSLVALRPDLKFTQALMDKVAPMTARYNWNGSQLFSLIGHSHYRVTDKPRYPDLWRKFNTSFEEVLFKRVSPAFITRLCEQGIPFISLHEFALYRNFHCRPATFYSYNYQIVSVVETQHWLESLTQTSVIFDKDFQGGPWAKPPMEIVSQTSAHLEAALIRKGFQKKALENGLEQFSQPNTKPISVPQP